MWGSPWRYVVLCVLFFFFHFQVIISISAFNSSPSAKICSHEQSSALLHFKNTISVDNSTGCYYGEYSYPKTESWKAGTDCCSWDGVTCDRFTGHVIGLDLGSSWLRGTISSNSSLFLLHHLQKLNLACNDFAESKISSKFGQFSKLTHLDLSYCMFEGSIPASLGNLTRITHLDLSSNNFTGQISASLSNLRQLSWLDLKGNKFSGQFPDIFQNLSKLTFVYLSGNNFSGRLPSSAFDLPQLVLLDFSANQFEGHIPCQVCGLSNLTDKSFAHDVRFGKIPSLAYLDLSKNKLTGPVPNSIFQFVNLTYLDLSFNNLSGIMRSDMFSALKNLWFVRLSYNSRLSSRAHNHVNFTLPKLERFMFSSCNLTEFPIFLRISTSLQILDLSNNSISGRISQLEFENLQSLIYLDLSGNFLTSFEQNLSMINLQVLNLRSNLIQGSLAVLSTSLTHLLVSDNKLTGQIPQSFCNLSSIWHLDLSDNSLSGTLPQCQGNYPMLTFLDLRRNNFHGNIPQAFAAGNIEYLNLNGNQLEGQLPASLFNCTTLEVLDVGNNMINDTFPHRLATLPKLKVLSLKSNRFHGAIGNSMTKFPFPKLRILDLSDNQFSGLLPRRYFENFNAMMHGDNNSIELEYMRNYPGEYGGLRPVLYYSVNLTIKGVNMEMARILTMFTTLDLSNNQFQGGIPEMVGKLNSLKVLNFSHNNLTGHIPQLLRNLTQLESLDLSSNKLDGEIPEQLTSLTSLSVINLSYNQLTGVIPQGPQFNTFQNDSYVGNLGLCGLPLSKKCSSDGPQERVPTIFQEEDDTSSWFDWKIALMGYGCGLVIGLSIGYIVFTTRRPQWFVRMVEKKQSIKMRRLNRRSRGQRN